MGMDMTGNTTGWRQGAATAPTSMHEVVIPPLDLGGTLSLPAAASGLVLFAHGSGSSRFSPRNTYVATRLQQAGFGTLLFDLLHEEEAADRQKVFDIPLLAERLVQATHWLQRQSGFETMPLGYFGASTGAAAALVAAVAAGPAVRAIVSRGGRPDLAGDALARVQTPTLLIVGGRDEVVLELNRRALAQMPCQKALSIVPGASHLFEEPGTLDQVVELARDWFARYLAAAERRQN